jgi:hypothetical protein
MMRPLRAVKLGRSRRLSPIIAYPSQIRCGRPRARESRTKAVDRRDLAEPARRASAAQMSPCALRPPVPGENERVTVRDVVIPWCLREPVDESDAGSRFS